jgi:hypothetical protein
VHYGHAELIRHSVLAALLTFSVGQPLFLVLARSLSERMMERQSLWTVNMAHLRLNDTAFWHSKNATNLLDTTYLPGAAAIVSCSEVDGLLIVMPFSLLAACTTWMWVSLRQAGYFDSDPRWDCELFSDPRMQLYELFYAIELFALICAILAIVADPASVEYILVYALLVCFLLLFFCSKSRSSGAVEGLEHIIGMFMFSILSTLISSFIAQHWASSCETKRSAAALLILFLPLLAILHMGTTEDTRAGHVILTRTFISCLFSLYFLILAAVNPNTSC